MQRVTVVSAYYEPLIYYRILIVCCWDNWCGKFRLVLAKSAFSQISPGAVERRTTCYMQKIMLQYSILLHDWCLCSGVFWIVIHENRVLQIFFHSPIWREKSYWLRLTCIIDLITISWMICKPLNSSLYLFHTVVEFFWRGSTPQSTTFVQAWVHYDYSIV